MSTTLEKTAAQLRTFRLDFPPEVSAERETAIQQILRLMEDNTPASVREACGLHSAWLERFPDDYAMLDLGGSLWMLADAVESIKKGLAVKSNAL